LARATVLIPADRPILERTGNKALSNFTPEVANNLPSMSERLTKFAIDIAAA
jgi:hypothetical protein